jgi:hypothetical protein
MTPSIPSQFVAHSLVICQSTVLFSNLHSCICDDIDMLSLSCQNSIKCATCRIGGEIYNLLFFALLPAKKRPEFLILKESSS